MELRSVLFRYEKQAKKEGMITMLEDGVVKCVQGVTTIQEIFIKFFFR